MYLKYIELYGFKSFANRTKIDLYPGINIIVGPNGCGKSNIVDAIKWCIGEMSRKALRMPSMTDVIFAGTSDKQQMNLAEVTLVFDNSERKLPIHFDEVAITRKIYRSEESEYFINRVSCRLKDIKEMFLDTGIGSNGYAIIDQGEIDEILLANAIERREVFEEVAGISRYKAKREETLAKLEKVSVDLSIVENSVAIIEQQIKKLEQDARKAKLRQQYMEELREAEIAMIVKNISEFYSQITSEEKLLEPIVKEISDVEVEISQLDAEKTKKELDLTEKNDIQRSISEKIVSVKLEISQIEGKIINNQQLVKEISSRKEYIVERHRKNIEIKNSLIPKIDELKKELEFILNEQKSISSRYEDFSKECSEIENRILQIDNQILEAEQKTLQHYQHEINTSNNLARLESEVSHINDDISSALREKEKVSNDLNLVLAEIKEAEEKLFSYNNTKNQLEKELSDNLAKKQQLEQDLKNIEEKNEKISFDIISLQSRYDTLIKDAEKDTYWIGTKSVLESSIDGVEGSVRNLIKLKNDNRVVFEDIFGEFTDAVIVRDYETAKKCIDYLKKESRGRARFLIMSQIPAVEISKELIDNFFDVSERYFNLAGYFLRGIKVEENNVMGDFWVCGGVEKVSSNESYWTELDEIKNTLNSLKLEKEKNLKLAENISYAISDIDAKKVDIENRLNETDTLIAVLRNRLSNLEEKRKISEENLAFINSEIEKLSGLKSELDGKISLVKQELEVVKNNSVSIKTNIEQLKKERSEFEKILIEKKQNLTSVKHNMETLGEKNLSLSQSIGSLENQLSSIITEESEYENSLSEMDNRVKELGDETVRLSEKREELINDLKELEIERSRVESEINELRNYLAHINTAIKENNEVLREKMEKKNEFDIRINTFKTKIEDLRKRLEMEYLLVYENIKDQYISYEVDEKRVEYLKKRIENIGAVNMAAPAEYEELMKEYEEKMKHINDLKQAKEDLKQAIVKINQTTKESLKSTFDKVNEHFKNIYSTLFNGGKANLVLTDPDNILESGIEIVACPPGKKLVNISQLSGGEKSLTAIALLFSFFCVNPSPFCVMDEVDAALDESNVERFVNLLKNFSPSTQFIVITHNKRTMEAGDRLYGVSMEEKGVSKIISVDLKKAFNIVEEANV